MARSSPMQNEPKQPPASQPDRRVVPDPDASKGHGMPPGATDDEPTGLPDSDRHHTETGPAKP